MAGPAGLEVRGIGAKGEPPDMADREDVRAIPIGHSIVVRPGIRIEEARSIIQSFAVRVSAR
jgi:hypothetical protein